MCDSFDQEEFICGSQYFDADEPARICIPTQTQIRQQLGSKLSDVFFEYLGSEARAYLGLEPPLEGPDTVWVAPGSRIEDKVALTPVPDPQVLHWKALTHGSILEVGQIYLEKVENKYRMDLNLALKRQAEELEDEFERRATDSVDFHAAVNEGTCSCKKVVATLMEHFDSCFNDLVKTTQLRMRKECQSRIEEERAEVAAIMFAQMKDQLERKDRELCSEFHDILYNELNILAARYNKKIMSEREVAVQLMRETVSTYEKMLQDARTEMEINNIVDVCQAITRERVTCNQKIKKEIIQAKETVTEEIIQQLKEENSILQEIAQERLKRLLEWRENVRILLEEFQKFINFAVQSVPGQSEFLLNFQKVLMERIPDDKFLKEYIIHKRCPGVKPSYTIITPVPSKKPVESKVFAPEPSLREVKKTTEENGSFEAPNLYCDSMEYKEADQETEFTFDYDTFKKLFVGKCVIDEPKRKARRCRRRRVACVCRKPKTEIDKESEMYQALTLAGEMEREHLAPPHCFLRKRLENIVNLCKADPEFTKLMLGSFDIKN